MNLEDRLRDGLGRAAGGSAEPPNWQAIRDRAFDRRRRRRALAYPLVGLVTVAVIVGSVVAVASVRNGDDDRKGVTAGPTNAAPPKEIVAVTADGRLVVLATEDGRELRTLAEGATTFAGNASQALQVSPDGGTVFFTRDLDVMCGSTERPVTEVARVDVDSGTAETVVGGVHYPALSPDGRYLAFTGVPNCSDGGRIVFIKDLDTGGGKEFTTEIPLSDGIGFLSWAPDSRHLTYTLFTESQGSFPRVIDTETETPLDQAPRIFNWDGSRIQNYLGETGDFLGTRCAGGTEPIQDVGIVRFDSAGGIDRTLFRLPEQCVGQTTASDPSGRHVLAIGLDPQALYRWSEGETEPTKVADGIVAAAWLPDRAQRTPSPEPEPAPEPEPETTLPCGPDVSFRPSYLPDGFAPDPVSGPGTESPWSTNPESPAVAHYADGGDRVIEIHHPGTSFGEILGRDGDYPNVDVLGTGATLAPIAPTRSEPLVVQFSFGEELPAEDCDRWSLDGYGVTESELRSFAEGLVPDP